MLVEPKTIRLKDGRTALLRCPETEDAAALIDYLKTVCGETPFLMRDADEVNFSLEQEEAFIRTMREDPRSLMLLALVEGEHAGNGSIQPASPFRRDAHRCTLGIALYPKYCGLGLGRLLMDAILLKAPQMGYEQVELEVCADNARAIALYESVGFQHYGRRPHGQKRPDGSYADKVLMVRPLKSAPSANEPARQRVLFVIRCRR